MNQAANKLTSKVYNSGSAHKVLGAFAAVVVALVLQGSLLAGFEHLAARNAVEGASATQMATLPAVNVVARRAESRG